MYVTLTRKYGILHDYQIINRIEIPVLFRLLYSSGLRINEVRLLRTKDVDLNVGIIHVRHTKGYNEHIVALHQSMLKLIHQYDHLIEKSFQIELFSFLT